jgi:hypothetical protein
MMFFVLNQMLVTIPPDWMGLFEFCGMMTLGVTLGPML